MSRMKQKCPEPRASPQVAVGRAERDPGRADAPCEASVQETAFDRAPCGPWPSPHQLQDPRRTWEAARGRGPPRGGRPGNPAKARQRRCCRRDAPGQGGFRKVAARRAGGRAGVRGERGDPGAAQRPGGAGGSGALQPGAALGGFRCTYNRRGLFPFRSSSLGGSGRGRGDPPGVRCPLPRAPPGASAF